MEVALLSDHQHSNCSARVRWVTYFDGPSGPSTSKQHDQTKYQMKLSSDFLTEIINPLVNSNCHPPSTQPIHRLIHRLINQPTNRPTDSPTNQPTTSQPTAGRAWPRWSLEAAAIHCLWAQQRSWALGALTPPCYKASPRCHEDGYPQNRIITPKNWFKTKYLHHENGHFEASSIFIDVVLLGFQGLGVHRFGCGTVGTKSPAAVGLQSWAGDLRISRGAAPLNELRIFKRHGSESKRGSCLEQVVFCTWDLFPTLACSQTSRFWR